MRAALLVLLAGCDIVLGLEKNPELPPEAGASPCGDRATVANNEFSDETELFKMFDRSETEGTTTIANGELVATSRVPTGYASVELNAPINFEDASAQVRFVKPVDPPNSESFFSLHLDDNNYYYFSIDSGIEMALKEGGTRTKTTTITFESAAHKLLRFSHVRARNLIAFETSVDGTVWTERYTIDVRFDLRVVRLRIGAGVFTPGSAVATTSVYDDFRICR